MEKSGIKTEENIQKSETRSHWRADINRLARYIQLARHAGFRP